MDDENVLALLDYSHRYGLDRLQQVGLGPRLAQSRKESACVTPLGVHVQRATRLLKRSFGVITCQAAFAEVHSPACTSYTLTLCVVVRLGDATAAARATWLGSALGGNAAQRLTTLASPRPG